MSDQATERLLSAAKLALKARTTKAAVQAAWSALHVDGPAIMAECFGRWCAVEDFEGHTSGLGEVLRRRHKTQKAVAASLTRAALRSDP